MPVVELVRLSRVNWPHIWVVWTFPRLSPDIQSAGMNLKSVNGVCAGSLDSSLRCAAFRMTEKTCASQSAAETADEMLI